MREQFRVFEPVRVRWADMDSFGHVNNACYFTFCESARIRYFEEIGMGEFAPAFAGDEAVDGEDERPGPALAQASLDFRAQVHYPARLEASARATRIGRSSFALDYAIFEEGRDEPVAEGTSVVVWIDYAVGKSRPLPEELRRRICDLDGL